jgi:Arc/MetJ-type ribon-helix-helix transcriptional regulator
MDKFEIPLTDELRAHLDVRVGANGYPDAGTYIRTLIEQDRSDLDELRAEIARGDASGISPRTADEIIEAAFRKYGASGA